MLQGVSGRDASDHTSLIAFLFNHKGFLLMRQTPLANHLLLPVLGGNFSTLAKKKEIWIEMYNKRNDFHRENIFSLVETTGRNPDFFGD